MQIQRKGEWVEILIPKEWNDFSIEYILKGIWEVPKKLMHTYRMNKSVKINGNEYNWKTKIQSGSKMQVHMFPQEDLGETPQFFDIQVLYEDDYILIVNKPSGMNMHPKENGQEDTLANAVAYHFLVHGIHSKVRHIHRLDQDTTGAVLFAKNALVGAKLDRMLEKRLITRTYVALVHGELKKKKGTINEPIGKDRHHSSKRRVSPTGQKAMTFYEVLHYDSKNNRTLVKLQLKTGRTHQIRVHMSYLGNPLIGDKLYGLKKKDSKPRQALHAAHISLSHPLTNEPCQILAPFLDNPPIFQGDLSNLL